jgi:autotransporter-associated beta strand protein
LAEDFSTLSPPTNLLNTGNDLTFNGGIMTIKGHATVTLSSQAFGNVTVNAGGGSLLATTGANQKTNSVSLGTITASASGGSLVLGAGSTSGVNIFRTTSDKDGQGIYGGRIIWANGTGDTGYDWPTTVSGSSPYTLSPYSAYSTMVAGATSDSLNDSTASLTLTGAHTHNSLKMTSGSVLALGTNSLTLTSGGLLSVGTSANTISGSGTVTAGSGSGYNLIVHQYNSTGLTISSPIGDNGANPVALVKSGIKTLTLSGPNTYTGGTYINAGTVSPQVASALGAPGSVNVTVQSAGILNMNGTLNVAGNLALNGGQLNIANNGAKPNWSGPVTLNANSILNAASAGGGGIVSGNIGGAGGFTKIGADMLILSGVANNYDGPTIVSVGPMTVKSSLYGNDSAKWIPANITVATNATLFLNVGGAYDFTAAQAATLFSNLASNVNNNGLKAGSIIGIDTANAGTLPAILSGVIADSTGPGGGLVSFKHLGAGTLELTGSNTFSGLVSTDNNGTLKVSSFNSVSSNPGLGTVHSASSSLGAPTTVANGAIWLGSQYTYAGGNITYTGTGETTDRVITLGGANGSSYTLDQSGSGLLKFTSSVALGNDNRGPKTIVLSGSTAGTGEIANTIPVMNATAGSETKLTKSGAGTWTLSAANANNGGVYTVNGGALVLTHATAIPGGIGASGGLSALTFNGGVIGLGIGDFTRSLAAAGIVTGVNFTGAGGWAAYGADRLVNLGGASTPITWVTASTGFNGKILILGNATSTHTVDFQNPLVLGTASCTVQVDDGAAVVDGKLSGILSGSAGGTLTKNGLGTLALTGANTYLAATIVNAGTLLVNGSNSGTGAVTVNAGAMLGGTGVVAAAVTAAAGGAINLRDGAVGTLTLGSSLTLSGSAASPNSLAFDLGNAADGADKIVVTGAHTANTANGALVSLNQLPGAAINPGTYTLIQGGVGTGNNFTGYTLATARAGRNVYSAFGASGSNLVVTVGAGNAGDSIGNVYWKGNTAFWNTAQWYADASESTQTNQPGYSSNVRFATVSPVTLSTTLGQDFEINSLTVDAGFAPIAITGNTLTLDATSDNSNTLGNGITIGSSAVVTIASKVGLAASQTWTVGPGASLTNSGVVSDFGGGYALSKAGAGTLTLTASSTIGGALTISDGTLTIGGAGQLNSGTYVVNIVNNGIFNYSSSANQTLSGVMSGTGALVKGGSSTLTLSGANTYSGGTTINAGTVSLATGVPGAIGTGPITINSGATLSVNNNSLNRALTLNGGTFKILGGTTDGVSGTINLTANSTIDFTQSNFSVNTIYSSISGTGGLTKTGAGVLMFSSSNNYSGPTVISQGGVRVKSSLYGNDPSKWTPANITVATNSVLGLYVGGTGEFTIGQVATMFVNLTTSVNNNGLRPGAIPTIYTVNAPAGTYTYSALLADSTGTGGGAVNFKFFGTANTTLELTGANTYSGVTLVENNGTLKVSSFNSVNGGNPPMATSSLGRPTTVANGTIWLGAGGWNGNNTLDTTYNSGNLVYTGTGETTDRVLNLAGYSGGSGARNYTLDQSGTGLLKFTSNLSIGANTTQTLILTGSTTGTGEIAGAIPNASLQATVLTKNGTGTWTLSGTNLYTGTTAVNQGTLLITGSISNGAVTVASGATLGGGGIIGSNVTYASGAKAIFTPGQTLKIMGALILNNNVVNVNVPANLSGGTYTLATYNTTGSSGTFATVPVAVNGTLSPLATITTANGTVKLYVPPKGSIISFL